MTAAIPDEYAESRGGFWTYSHETVANMEALAERYPALARPLYSPPKPVLFSELMSYADIAGMYFPFTVESNINTDGPFFTIPATMGHEMAHQCGFMREDEANFIGYLACKDASRPAHALQRLLARLRLLASAPSSRRRPRRGPRALPIRFPRP